MSVNIVTGMVGQDHITSDDDRERIASVFGRGKYVLPVGEQFSYQKLSDNLILIRDGMAVNQGTQMGIELVDFEEITIENGSVGTKRNDLIALRYEKDGSNGVENASMVVIKGTAGETAVDPSYTSGNILDGGDLIDDFPLYRVKIDGVSITEIQPLFTVISYDLESLKNDINGHSGQLYGLSSRMTNAENAIETKQPILIPGQNISMKRNADGTVTINAVGGGGGEDRGSYARQLTDIHAEHATVTTSAVGEVTG